MDYPIIASLYLVTAIIYIVREILYIKRVNTIKLISTFRLMYSFIYGILPAVILYNYRDVDLIIKRNNIDLTYTFILAWFISVIEYTILSMAYSKTRQSSSYYRQTSSYSYKTIQTAVIISIVIGTISLFLWTSAFGSVYGMIVSANLIRAQASDVSNQWAFLEHVTRIFTVTYFVAFALFLYVKEYFHKGFLQFVLVLLSLFGSLIVMLCTDSRGQIGILVIVTIMYYFVFYKLRQQKNIVKSLVPIGLIMIGAFVLIILSDGIMNNIRNITVNEVSDTNIVTTLVSEFGFTFTSQVVALQKMFEEPFSFLIYNDIVNGLFRWIPSQYIPFKLPQNIWDYNTQQLLKIENFNGQAPSDFVTTSLYSFGFIGILIQPVFMGYLLKKIETFFRRINPSLFHTAIYAYFYFFSIWWVGFCSISSTVLSLFGLALLGIIVVMVAKIKKVKNI